MLLGLGLDVDVYLKQWTNTMLTFVVKVAQKKTRANPLVVSGQIHKVDP